MQTVQVAMNTSTTGQGRRCGGPGAVNVALPGAKLLVPGVVVVAAGAVGETATRLPPGRIASLSWSSWTRLT